MKAVEPTDEELVVAVKDGNLSAFETLVKRYQKRLLPGVLAIVGDYQAAEEVIQDSLFAVYRAIDRVDTSRKFSSYVMTIARNVAISRLRQNKAQVTTLSEEVASEEEVIEEFARRDEAEGLRKKVDLLPPKYRLPLVLYYFENLSYEQISKRLKLLLNTTRTRLRRARGLLAKVYEKN